MRNDGGLADLLFGSYRRRVLAQLLLRPEASLHLRELARLTGASPGSLARELAKLTEAGVLLRRESGNQVHYQANRDCPLCAELAGIFRKTDGAAQVVREALWPLAGRIRVACLFGSTARGSDSVGSDVDVLVLGDVGFADLVTALYPAQQALGREINPVLYSPQEFADRLRRGDNFARELLAGAKIYLIGGADELADHGRAAAHGDRAGCPAQATQSQ